MLTMLRRPARTRPAPRLLVGALALPLLAAGCGFNYQTDMVYQAGVGANDRTGQVDVLNAVVVSSKPGQGTLVTSLANNNVTHADRLQSVQVQGGQAQTESIAIPANGLVNLATSGGIPLTGSASTMKAGGYVTVRFVFANAQQATVDVPLVAPTNEFASFTPSPSAPAPTMSPLKSTKGTAGTPTPSTSPTSSPTG